MRLKLDIQDLKFVFRSVIEFFNSHILCKVEYTTRFQGSAFSPSHRTKFWILVRIRRSLLIRNKHVRVIKIFLSGIMFSPLFSPFSYNKNQYTVANLSRTLYNTAA